MFPFDNDDEHVQAGPALVAIAILVMAAVFSGPSRAAPRALSDAEMSAVRGADGTIALPAAPAGGGDDAVAGGLAAAFASSTGPTMLDAAGFAAALQEAGWPAGVRLPGYDGQAVAQTRVDAQPVTFSADLSALLLTSTGLGYHGPSMGMITLRDFDARGTTLWTWHH